jgi:hypothetical protein
MHKGFGATFIPRSRSENKGSFEFECKAYRTSVPLYSARTSSMRLVRASRPIRPRVSSAIVHELVADNDRHRS